MTTPELSSPQSLKSIKAKSWITLTGGAIICLIPFIGLIMWLLFLPVIILVGRWGYKLIGLGDTKGGVIHLASAAVFVPFAFLSPVISTGLTYDLLWPSPSGNASADSKSTATAPDGSAKQPEMSVEVTEEKTRQTWSKLMTALNAMNEFNSSNMSLMLEGRSHLPQDAVMDLTIQVFWTVGQIKTEGADPELDAFMKQMSAEGIDVFQRMKMLTQVGRNAGSNVTQGEATAYVHALKALLERLGSIGQNHVKMHAFLTNKYGAGFESPARGGKLAPSP